MSQLRIYLTGRVSLENGAKFLEERDFPGRQGRLVFAFLVTERHRPANRDELVSIIWPDGPPRDADGALNAILSKLRTSLKKVGTNSGSIEVLTGSVQLRLPADVWIDTEAAANAIDQAEGALRAGGVAHAWGDANIAAIITRRPFLADEEAPWIEARRTRLRSILARALHALSEISIINGESALALQHAADAIEVEPFRESGYRHLMRLHAQMGNRAEALRVFGKCRELLRDELGANPSQETEAAFLEILRAGSQV